MKVRRGYAVSSGYGEKPLESDTYTCNHCNTIKFLHRGNVDPGGYCAMCDYQICSDCAGRGVCDPFVRQVEKEAANAYRRTQFMRAAGLTEE